MVSSVPQSLDSCKKYNAERLERMRHTCAYIMVMMVQKLTIVGKGEENWRC